MPVGTLLVRDGIITGIGDVSVPGDARIWDLEGRTIYPGLIASYSSYGMPEPLSEESVKNEDHASSDAHRGPLSWNPNVRSHMSAAELFVPDPTAAQKLRGTGITAAIVLPPGGVFRGTSALVSLGDGTANDQIIRSRVAHHASLQTAEGDIYPRSLMGAIALIRQTLYDAQWYQKASEAYSKNSSLSRPEVNEPLAALDDVIQGHFPLIIQASDEKNALRAHAIGEEFSLRLIVQGSGYEYRRLDAIRATGRPILVPVDFPTAPTVDSPEQALQISLARLRHWDEAPENPSRLAGAGVSIALIAVDHPDSLVENVRRAVQRGLSSDDALKALTTTPAVLFGVEKLVGTLEPGKIANFIVTDGQLFRPSTSILETWVDGKRYTIQPLPEIDPRGLWTVATPRKEADSLTLNIQGSLDSLHATIGKNEPIRARRLVYGSSMIEFMFPGDTLGVTGLVRMSATILENRLVGTGEWPDGTAFSWTGILADKQTGGHRAVRKEVTVRASFPPSYPPGAYGRTRAPDQPPAVLLKGATIWTCGPEGILQKSDLLVRKGRIAEIDQHLEPPAGALIIDASGKHITPGLIDAHSHMAVSGSVNEPTQAISAEVRIGDVVDCDDVSLYRALAGGLTVAHLLHGSANPIGGQAQLIKLRWGMLPDEMKFRNATPTVKFALGENVKQSNWGDRYTTRYPQTRMGVVQTLRDAFRAARDYDRAWKEYTRSGKGVPPRSDLELDALLEIIRGERLVHCHSYRQDEILATMRVAEEFGFAIGTFQHILEGYKVADVMAEHGAAASSFSDWWAYKLEVYDAIPYNGALMHEQGVLVSFNSDSDELARRMNLEAAKAVKYGGLSEEEALKFVTINPARQLKIQDRVGSIEPGKDADFVIWSGSPLSTYTICEQTWVDGRRFFDRKEDQRMQEEVNRQRAALIQKILSREVTP
jgi:imidazolonepropionase-like amidohydrolase